MKLKSFTTAAIAATVLSTAAIGTASATSINFDQNRASNPSGTLSYDGNGGSLNGTNISFTYLDVDNGQSLECTTRCMLNFSTGNNTSEADGQGPYTFAGGGTFTLTGALADADTGEAIPGTGSEEPLLSGSFDGTQTGASNYKSFSFIGNGSTSVSQSFLTYLGLDSDTPFAFINSTFSLGKTVFDDNGGFTGDISNADLTVRDVPEPSELAMFGMGLMLLGGGLYARRRRG